MFNLKTYSIKNRLALLDWNNIVGRLKLLQDFLKGKLEEATLTEDLNVFLKNKDKFFCKLFEFDNDLNDQEIKEVTNFIVKCVKKFGRGEKISRFIPNEIYINAIEADDGLKFENVDYVDLTKIDDKTIVHLRGTHPSSRYRLKVEDIKEGRKVSVWGINNRNANGLIGDVLSIFSIEYGLDEMGPQRIHKGLIKKNMHYQFPYFSYESADGMLHVIIPDDASRDVATSIEIYIKKGKLSEFFGRFFGNL
ncbi:MAG TPA: hypothetical protein VI564_05015 [Candidatus Nanoarchaeia archaeon]|nr:hypothetical protein [Candidatus Nanoarchaeia archaeon]